MTDPDRFRPLGLEVGPAANVLGAEQEWTPPAPRVLGRGRNEPKFPGGDPNLRSAGVCTHCPASQGPWLCGDS